MGFSRIERLEAYDPITERAQFEHKSVWLKPDQFTAGLFNVLSGGSLRNKTVFASVYPDFSEWVFWSGNTVQHESTTAPFRDSSKGDGFGEKGLKVQSWWEHSGSLEVAYRAPLPQKDSYGPEMEFETIDYEAEANRRLIGMRLGLRKAAADADEH